MQRKITLILLFSILTFMCIDRPENVPKEASFEDNMYFLFDSHDGKKRFRSWTKDGVIDSESVGEGEDEYRKVYLNGQIIREGYSKDLDAPKQRTRSKIIPDKATWSYIMNGWESGNFVNGRKDGVWKIWYESGVPLGFIHYKNGILLGEAREYDEDTGSLLEIKTFYDNENKGIIMYYPEDDYDKLPKVLKKILEPLPKNEPLIKEFFDDIPIGAKSFTPMPRQKK